MKLSVRKKLVLSFSAINLLLMIIAIIAYTQLYSVNKQYSEAIEDRLEKIAISSDMADYLYEELLAIRGYLASSSTIHLDNFNKAAKDFQTQADLLMSLEHPEEGTALAQNLIETEAKYREIAQRLIKLKQDNQTAAYEALMNGEGSTIVTEVHKAKDDLIAYHQEDFIKQSTEINEDVATLRIAVLIISIAAIICGIVLAIMISRNLSKPIRLVSDAANQIAHGDLQVKQLKIKNKDEIGDLADSFNTMTDNLRGLIRQVSITSKQVAASAQQLTASAEQTSMATGQVTNSIGEVAKGGEDLTVHANETAATINQMADGMQRVADTISSISEAASQNAEQATIGSSSLIKITEQMNSIQSSSSEMNEVIKELNIRSQQIGKIIEVITGIAEQTNLLALNAAIESARAGEHGRGFAVVADEVKKLAEQSNESAHQIAELIQATQGDTVKVVEMMEKEIQEVSEGMKLVEETDVVFKSILTAINNIGMEFQEVSAVSEEMSASIEEVSAAVHEVANIVQSTSANAGEVASASEEQLASMDEISLSASSLAKTSEELNDLIKNFKL